MPVECHALFGFIGFVTGWIAIASTDVILALFNPEDIAFKPPQRFLSFTLRSKLSEKNSLKRRHNGCKPVILTLPFLAYSGYIRIFPIVFGLCVYLIH
jgi:hypothetical protein